MTVALQDPLGAVRVASRLLEQSREFGLETRISSDFNAFATLRLELRKAEKDDPVGSAAGAADSYVERFRDYKYRETLYELFTKQYELARVDESREGALIQVIDTAQAPERKSKPKKALIAVIATLAAGFALLLFVFVRQALANASQDPESAAKLAGIRRAFRRALGLRQ